MIRKKNLRDRSTTTMFINLFLLFTIIIFIPVITLIKGERIVPLLIHIPLALFAFPLFVFATSGRVDYFDMFDDLKYWIKTRKYMFKEKREDFKREVDDIREEFNNRHYVTPNEKGTVTKYYNYVIKCMEEKNWTGMYTDYTYMLEKIEKYTR